MSTNMTIFSTEIFEKKSFFVYFLTGEKIHVQLLELEIIKAGVSLNYSEIFVIMHKLNLVLTRYSFVGSSVISSHYNMEIYD